MTSDKYKNYYETLGLNSSASKEEINKAFRELSHLYHPDNVVGKPQNIQEIAAKKFNEISQARKILIDYIEEEIQDDQSFRQNHNYDDDDEYAEDDDETEYSEEDEEEDDDEEEDFGFIKTDCYFFLTANVISTDFFIFFNNKSIGMNKK